MGDSIGKHDRSESPKPGLGARRRALIEKDINRKPTVHAVASTVGEAQVWNSGDRDGNYLGGINCPCPTLISEPQVLQTCSSRTPVEKYLVATASHSGHGALPASV